MRYPRSFVKLLLTAFALVVLPLAGALVTSAVSVDQLANRSQTAVFQAVQATQSSRRLSELLTAMERSARQTVILNDRSLLEGYRVSRAQFQQTAAQFAALPFDSAQRADLEAILGAEQQIYAALANPAIRPATLQAQVSRFAELSGRAQSIMATSGLLINREVEAMRELADDARRVMLWQALALIPLLVVVVGGFTFLIARPIRQIESAMREIGNGRLNMQVAVSGPADLEYLGERLDRMRRSLLELEQQKNRFLQQVSHDLKTPLTALREGSQLLSDDVVGKLTEEQREIAQILRHNSMLLQQRIEQLLDYGAIQFHKLDLGSTQVDLRSVLEGVAQGQKLALDAKNVTLRLPSTGVMLAADAGKLRVILDNLLSNAIRFSPAGAVIQVNLQSDARHAIVDVIDEGPGISPADLPHVFEPYYQGRVQAGGPVDGSGLGLSIVREYVAAHRGSVEVVAGSSARGAHLRVRLPLSPGAG